MKTKITIYSTVNVLLLLRPHFAHIFYCKLCSFLARAQEYALLPDFLIATPLVLLIYNILLLFQVL